MGDDMPLCRRSTASSSTVRAPYSTRSIMEDEDGTLGDVSTVPGPLAEADGSRRDEWLLHTLFSFRARVFPFADRIWRSTVHGNSPITKQAD